MDNTNKNINKNSNTNENKKINNKRGSEYKEQLEKLKDKNYIKELEKQGIKVVSVNDRDYPAKLLPYNHRPATAYLSLLPSGAAIMHIVVK